MAAFALGLLGDAAAVERLLASLQDPEAVVRARAAEALGRIGGAARGARPWRASLLDDAAARPRPLTVRGDDPGSATDPWLVLRLGAVRAGPPQGRRRRRVRRLLDGGRPRFDWWAATWTAMRAGAAPPCARCSWRPPPPATRSRARWPRAGWARSRTPGVRGPARPGWLRDKDAARGGARRCARWARIGDARGVPRGGRAAPLANPVLRGRRCSALAALPPDRDAARAGRGRWSGHERPWIRAAAFPALARLDREDFALVLSGLDPDPVWFVRARLAGALGDAGDEVSVRLLLRLAQGRRTRAWCRRCWTALRAGARAPSRSTPCAATSPTPTSGARGGRRGPGRAQGHGPVAPRSLAAYERGPARPRPRRAAGGSRRSPSRRTRAGAAALLAQSPTSDPARAVRLQPRRRAAARAGQRSACPGAETMPSAAPLDYRDGHGALRSAARAAALHAAAAPAHCARA